LTQLDEEALGDVVQAIKRNSVSVITDSSTLGGAKAVIGYSLLPGARSAPGSSPQAAALWTLQFPGADRQVSEAIADEICGVLRSITASCAPLDGVMPSVADKINAVVADNCSTMTNGKSLLLHVRFAVASQLVVNRITCCAMFASALIRVKVEFPGVLGVHCVVHLVNLLAKLLFRAPTAGARRGRLVQGGQDQAVFEAFMEAELAALMDGVVPANADQAADAAAGGGSAAGGGGAGSVAPLSAFIPLGAIEDMDILAPHVLQRSVWCYQGCP